MALMAKLEEAARDGAGLGGACAAASGQRRLGPDFSTLRRKMAAANLRISATHRPCQTSASEVRPERGLLGRAGDHREGRGEREDRRADRLAAHRLADAERGEAEQHDLAPWSPASTASAPRARSRPGRRCRGRSRRSADSSSRNRPGPGPGRPASRPPGRQARQARRSIQIAIAAAPAAVQTVMPTSDMASMANSLPRKMASIGTAAARTSITLFDFSSISCDSSMPASRMVRTNSRVWPPRAVTLRAKATGCRTSCRSCVTCSCVARRTGALDLASAAPRRRYRPTWRTVAAVGCRPRR